MTKHSWWNRCPASKGKMQTHSAACKKVCKPPPAPKNTTQSQIDPKSAPKYIPTDQRNDWANYQMLPVAPYPPGTAPEGGAGNLQITAEKYGQLAIESPCFQCNLQQSVEAEMKLRLDWRFWLGLGAAGIGITMVLARR